MLSFLLKLVTLVAMMGTVASAAWQAHRFSNMSKIYTIYSKINYAIEQGMPADTLAPFLSGEFNKLWDPYWYVMVLKSDASACTNAVVYGYAFR